MSIFSNVTEHDLTNLRKLADQTRQRSGIFHNFKMDVDPGCKYVEKFRGGVQWYMMESKDIISSICFKLKK